jgi:hypothetical protein
LRPSTAIRPSGHLAAMTSAPRGAHPSQLYTSADRPCSQIAAAVRLPSPNGRSFRRSESLCGLVTLECRRARRDFADGVARRVGAWWLERGGQA